MAVDVESGFRLIINSGEFFVPLAVAEGTPPIDAASVPVGGGLLLIGVLIGLGIKTARRWGWSRS